MTNLIEEADAQRQRHMKRFLLAFYLVAVLLFVRHLFGTTFKAHELNSHPIGIGVLAVSIAAVVAMFVHVIKLAQLKKKAEADPQLREALLDNELIRLHVTESWRAGFIGAVVTPFAFLLIASFFPFSDLLVVALSTALVGSGAFLTSLYVKSNR